MTIDIRAESLCRIRKVPKRLPEPVHLATVWRWIQRGCRGIKLETILVGGKRYTSDEALQRFFDRVTAAADGTSTPNPKAIFNRRAIEQANQELDEAGI